MWLINNIFFLQTFPSLLLCCRRQRPFHLQTRAVEAEETRWNQGGGQPGLLRISKRAPCLQPGVGREILQTLEVIIKPFHLRRSGVEVLSRAEPQTRTTLKRITQAAELCSHCSNPGKRRWWLGLAEEMVTSGWITCLQISRLHGPTRLQISRANRFSWLTE